MLIGTVRAINDLTYWRITVTNGPVPNTNVAVEFTIPTEFSISNSTIVPVGTLVGDTWTVGAMTPGQTISADIILKFDGPVPGVAEEFEVEATVTGTGDTNSSNNTKIDTINFEILSCDPFASGSNCSDGLKFDLSECSTPCTQGATPHWTINEEGSVNVEIISFDEDTGIGFYKFIDPTLQGTISWGLECILGLDTITICASYTLTLHPIIDDKNVFDHTADFINGSLLSDPQVATLKDQPAYSGFTDEQIREFCWEVLYNSNGDLVGGWAHACTGEQDNRSFVYCSDEACVAPPVEPCPSCPGGSMPTNVATYINSIPNYTPTKGDNITVYHTVHGGISTYEYSGTQWVRSSCGCIVFVSEDDGNLISTGTDGGAFLAEEDLPAFIANPTITDITFTKSAFVAGASTVTCTVTFSSGPPIIRTFTDIDTNTTYNFNIVDDNLIITPSNGPTQSLSLPTGTGGDNWGSQVVQRTAVFTGNGVLGMPLDLADGGITNIKIANGTITLTKLNQNGAILGQVITWNGTNWAPATPILETGNNVGSSGSRVYKDKTSNTFNFRRLVAGTNMSITEGTDTITFDSTTSSCICYVDATYNSTSGEFYLHQSGFCDGVTDITWQTADPFAITPTFADVQTGGAVFSLLCDGTEIAVRVKYAQNGCTRYSQIIQVTPPNC